MNHENFDRLIKERTINPPPPSDEQLKSLQTFSKKRVFAQRLYTGIATFCVALLLTSAYSFNLSQEAKMLSESDMIFINDLLAFETDETTVTDDDLYLYSELITL
ncbi:MAG: hypothetical protein ACRBBP_06005 [Bdellovibrionales bacterium]